MAEDGKKDLNMLGFLGKQWGVVNKKQEKELSNVGTVSIATPDSMDGSFHISASMNPYVGGVYSSFVDIDSIVKNDQQAISTFRQIATYSDCERAIDEIVNDSIVKDPDTGKIVDIDLTLVEGVSENLKDKIREEFKAVLKLYNFNKDARKIFRQWYIDGKIFYMTVVNPDKISEGIERLELISPLKIMRITNHIKKENDAGIEVNIQTEDFYIFNDKGLGQNKTMLTQETSDIQIPTINVIEVNSGWMDMQQRRSRSFLLGSIRPVNILKMMEDAVVIYRMSRAPERRVFYIDVSEMNAEDAEEYTNKFKAQFRNRVTYNPSTGERTDKKRFINAVEDYYIPRAGEGKGTEITSLPGAQNLGEIGDLGYFQKKVWESLKIPTSRLKEDTPFSSGKGTAITHEEIKFQKYVQTVRESFSELFVQALEKQLIFKNIFDADSWKEIRDDIRFRYVNDALFIEMQNQERLANQAETIDAMMPYLGQCFNLEDDILRQVRGLNDVQIKEFHEQKAEEVSSGIAPDHKRRQELEMKQMEGEAEQAVNPPVPASAKASAPKPKPKPKAKKG